MAGLRVAINGWFWGQLSTGSGQYLHHLLDHLPPVAPQLDLTLVLPRASGQGSAFPPAEPAATRTWQVHPVTTPLDRVNENLAKVWFEQVAFPKACRQLAADIAFVPYWGSPWWRPARTVVTVHDLIPLLLPAYRGGPAQRTYTRLVSLTAKRAHAVLTDSHASRQDIVRHLGIPSQRVHAVLLAAADRFQPVADPAELARVRAKYGLPQDFILYLGGFDVRKNVAMLVQAYARWVRAETARAGGPVILPIPRLVIAGKLPAEDTPFTPDPRRAVAHEAISDRVLFTGWIDEADKPALYSLANLFVFPSLYEGFGLPVAEAAACGTPVLTSNRSSLPEAAPNATLVDPTDVAALSSALAQAMESRQPSSPGPGRTWSDVATETARALFAAAMAGR